MQGFRGQELLLHWHHDPATGNCVGVIAPNRHARAFGIGATAFLILAAINLSVSIVQPFTGSGNPSAFLLVWGFVTLSMGLQELLALGDSVHLTVASTRLINSAEDLVWMTGGTEAPGRITP